MKRQVIHGDSLKIMKFLADKTVDHVFTSPPYNRKRNDKYQHYDDTLDDYFLFLKTSIAEMLRITRGYVFFNIQKNYYNKVEVNKIIGEFAEKIVEIIIWEKTNPMPAQGNAITNSWEFFLVLGDKPLKSNSTYTKNIISTSVNSKMPSSHKAVMKQEVAEWFIEKFTQPGETIMDPFAGTGTTGAAAEKLGRNSVMLEKEEEYIKIIAERFGALPVEK